MISTLPATFPTLHSQAQGPAVVQSSAGSLHRAAPFFSLRPSKRHTQMAHTHTQVAGYDGVQPELTMQVGKTYTFDQTNASNW
jgi:hypothetical protein